MILLKDALAQARRERGLTQEELAARLYITRQAVSRWETGATEPGIDMIKLIARELEVPAMRLLDMPEHYCQSCGMMFTGPDQHGREADGTETEDFCRWCYDQGAYTYETTMEEMIEDCAPRMAKHMDWSVDECASLLGAILPTLRRWRESARPNE
nr:zinc ribbon domain-containing protein [uncultured Collinsella sp.]